MSRLAASSAAAAIDSRLEAPRAADAPDSGSRYYYGWTMVPLAMAVMVASAPGQTYGFMTFNAPLRRSLALSQTEFSAIYLLATLAAAAPLSFLGRLSDQYGLKRSLLASIAAMAGVSLLASVAQNGPMLLAACFGLRLFGAGLMSLLATNTLAAWFDRRLGLACGIMQLGGAVSVALAPIALMFVIDAVGWRTTYVLIGAGLLAALWPTIALFYYERPEDLGQRLDGDAAPPAWEHSPAARRAADAPHLRVVDDANPPSLNLHEVLRTRIFWLLLMSTAVWSLIATGLMFHVESLLAACSLAARHAAWATPLMAAAMAAVLLGGGMLVDRVPIRALLAAALVCVGVGCIVLAHVTGPAALAAYAVYGVGQGLMTVVGSASWAKIFGPAHLGHIRGTAMTVGIACSALGPLVMGASADYLGGFDPSLWLFATVAAAVAAAGALTAPADASLTLGE